MTNTISFLFSVFVYFLYIDLGWAECPVIVTRPRWAARKPEQVDYQSLPVQNVIISHTATPRCNKLSECARMLANIQNYHIDDLHYGDIGYSFMIGSDGNIYEGRGWVREGAHTYGWNSRSVGIAFIGNYEDTPANEQQMNALRELLSCGVEEIFLSETYRLLGQRQIQSTLSPGLALYEQLQNLTAWTEIITR